MSVWFKRCLNPWYIWIPSNPNLYWTKIIIKMRWQNNCKQCSICIISHTTTPLPKSYDCVAVYIAGRRTSLVVYGWWPQPPTKKGTTKHYSLTQSRDFRSGAPHFGELNIEYRACSMTTLLLSRALPGLAIMTSHSQIMPSRRANSPKHAHRPAALGTGDRCHFTSHWLWVLVNLTSFNVLW